MDNEIAEKLHTGGINKVVMINRVVAEGVANHLVSCVDHEGAHVFVVDGSRGNMVAFGVSGTGLECISTYLKEEWKFDIGSI